MERWRSLLAELDGLSDRRRREGRRHGVGSVVLLSILAVVGGCSGYRAIGHFVEANAGDLSKLLGTGKGRLPSYSTVRRVLMGLPAQELARVLGRWQGIEAGSGAWLHLDGKALKGTIRDYSASSQDFTAVVSVYLARQRAVLASAAYRNKQVSEGQVARELLALLEMEQAVVTADALHAQKNSGPAPLPRPALPAQGESQPAAALPTAAAAV